MRMYPPALAAICVILLFKGGTNLYSHHSLEQKDEVEIAASPLDYCQHRSSITKIIHVDYSIMQHSEEIHQEMWPAERTQYFHQNMTFDPIQDGTLGAASPKTIDL